MHDTNQPTIFDRRLLLSGAFASTLMALPLVGRTQAAYPNKTIRMIVPYAPGGAADPCARLLSQKMPDTLGQAVVVENYPGAGGNIGANMVAKAAPDGYTLGMFAASTVTINKSLYPTMPFDPEKDFAPVALMSLDQIVLVASVNAPFKNLKELIDLARAKPGQLNYASGGSGSGGHLGMELFKSMTGINIVHIPFKGAGNTLTSTISGEVSMTMTSAGSVLSLVQQGKLKAIAGGGAKRLAGLPDVPAVAETVPGYEMGGWYGVLAPARTPADIISRLNTEINRIVQDPDVKARLDKMGLLPATGTPEELGRIMQKDSVKWAGVIKQSQIKMD